MSMPMRSLAVFITSILLLAAAAPSPGEDSTTQSSARVPVLLLPARADYFTKGVSKVAPSIEKSAGIRKNLDVVAADILDQSNSLSRVDLPVLSAEEQSSIDDFMRLAQFLLAYRGGRSAAGSTWNHNAGFYPGIGSSLKFLSSRTGTRFALGVIGAEFDQSVSDAVLATVANAPLLSFKPLMYQIDPELTPMTRSHAGSFLIDLQSGDLRWYRVRNYYETLGIRQWTLSDEQSARALMLRVMGPPHEPSTAEDAPTVQVAASHDAHRHAATPITGGFAFIPPADWAVEASDTAVTTTLDGNFLNQVRVELRGHGQAFPVSARSSSRKSLPADLLADYTAELRAMKIENLEIIDSSSSSQLGSIPSFRIHFSYRLPAGWSGVRIEQVVVGAAVKNGLLLAALRAPAVFYFSKSLPDFEASLATVELKTKHNAR